MRFSTRSARVLRGTLKRLAEEVGGSSLVRCHRAYVVNTNRVIRSAGNLHKMQLNLDGMQKVIPVSRNYTENIRTLLSGRETVMYPK